MMITRWSSRNDALFTIKKNYLIVMKALYQLISTRKDNREECQNTINVLENCDFIVFAIFFYRFFEIINFVSTV